MNILNEILDAKRIEVSERSALTSLEGLCHEVRDLPPPPRFSDAFSKGEVGLIAEVKHRSPSAGVIRDPFEPADIARAYEAGGAAALSVLMDEPFFGGGEEDFLAVRESVALPMLYKEFVIDPWQIWHARSLGASAVLLIAAALSDGEIEELAREADRAEVEALLEVHDAAELARAVRSGIHLIGINNRDLKTFETTLETTRALADRVPEDRILISESGIRTHADVARLKKAGVKGVLVGEHLLRKPDLEKAVRELMGG